MTSNNYNRRLTATPTIGPDGFQVAGPPFYNRDGSLTDYSLHCGYVQTHTTSTLQFYARTTLHHEHGTYHIQSSGGYAKAIWDVADTLTAARRIYRRHIREYHSTN